MKTVEKTKDRKMKTRFSTVLPAVLALLLSIPAAAFAQVEEEQQQESVDPRLLMSNADNFYRIAKDKIQTQSGDPTADFGESISYFNRYLTALPSASFEDSVQVFSRLADSYYSLSQWSEDNGVDPVWEDAIRYYEWLIEREPPGEDIAYDHFCVAWAKSRLEGWNAGTPHMERYLELRPEDLDKRIWVARIYLSLMDNNRALDHFLIYLAANPADQAIVTEILNLRIRLTMRYEEITLKLIEHLPDTPKYLQDISQHFFSRAREDEGLDYLLQYLEKEPENMAALKTLGDEYKRRGDWDQAMTAYRRILSIDSSAINARCDMAAIYMQRQDIDAAIREAKRAMAIDSNHPYANNVMGDAGQQWAFRQYAIAYPGREVEKMMYDYKTLMKMIADTYYEKAKNDPQLRTHAQNQINYLSQFFPQNQDMFMWDKEKDHIIPFPPPS